MHETHSPSMYGGLTTGVAPVQLYHSSFSDVLLSGASVYLNQQMHGQILRLEQSQQGQIN